MKPGIAAALLLVALLGASPARAYEPVKFDSPAEASRYQALLKQLRCLVFQNETLADSQADLAKDLRGEIHEMVLAGKTDDQIKAYLVDRYGDFVLYRPPFKTSTLLLWAGPFVLGVAGIGFLLVQVRRRRAVRAGETPMDDVDRKRVAALLDARTDRSGTP